MKPAKSIKALNALDYDPTALTEIEQGFSMARAMNEEITLLHSMSDLIYYASTKQLLLIRRTDSKNRDQQQIHGDDQFKKESQQFLEKIQHLLNDESFVNALEEGEFDASVLMNSKGTCTDVLVTGSQSHRWLKDLVQGSVSQKVVSRTFVPVYRIPSKQRDRVSMI